MKGPPTEALDGMREVLGPRGFLDQPADLEPYLVDFRKLYHGATALVARPASLAEVVECVKICAKYRVGIVPQGGNTGYCGGATPDATGSQIVLSLQRMNSIRRIDAAGYSMTLDAGCTLLQAQQAAEHAQRLFPLSLGSEGSCQIGGNISTNAGGTSVLRYGTMRDLVLGLEAVLPNGRVVSQLTGLRKDNTGYDVKQLFIGAEGTLGVVTGATLKLFPLPASYATALLAVDDLDAAVAVLARIRERLGDCVVAFEVMPRIAVELAVRHIVGVTDPLSAAHPWYALSEIAVPTAGESIVADFQALLAELIDTGRICDAAWAASDSQRVALWRMRENIPAAQSKEGASLKHDVSLPIAALPEFVRTGGAAVASIAPGARMVAYGHVGDGNLHFNFSQPPGTEASAFLGLGERIKRTVHDLVVARQGSISAEHGIGQLKIDELERYEDPTALALMRALKRNIDPDGIMNPGKVLKSGY